MHIIETSQPTGKQKAAILRLWNAEYPQKLSFDKMEKFQDHLNTLPELHLYLLDNEMHETEGFAMTFIRNNERWFALVVDSNIQGKGNGTLLLNKMKSNNEALHGWVIDHENDVKQNGELYRSPMNFYLKNGFTIRPEVRSETVVLSAVKIEWKRMDKL